MIQQKISGDLKEFLKSGKSFEVGVLRLIIAAFKNKEIEKRGKGKEETLTNDEEIEILSREAKKRKEAIEIYSKNNRSDLAEQEAKELEIIKKYLPAELSKEEIEKIINKAIAESGANSQKDIGKVMKLVMVELKGKADASLVSGIIRQKLNG